MAQPPQFLTLKRHRELEGVYTTGLVVRWIAYALIGAVAILGLLNVFGQRPSTATADASAARLELYAPTHTRGGLLFMARFSITANQDLKNATLVLDPGWAEDMTINTIEPSPTDETSENGKLALSSARSRRATPICSSWSSRSTRRTSVGSTQNVELRDGDTHISTIHRTMTVFP